MPLLILNVLSSIKFIKSVNFIRFHAVSALAHSNLSPIEEEEERILNSQNQKPLNSSQFDTVKALQTLNSFKNEPGLALSYFDQLKGSGFYHDLCTYAAMVRILCYWGRVKDLDSILLEIIRKDRGYDFETVKTLFRILANGLDGEFLSPNVLFQVSDALVKVYAIAGMFDEAMDFLFQFDRCGFIPVPCVLSVNFLMNKLIFCGKADLSVAIYRKLKNIGLSPNEYTYTIAIKAFCRQCKFDEVEKVFEEMEEVGLPPNGFAYTTYIEGFCSNGRTDSGFQLLEACMAHQIPIGVFAYTVVIRGFCNEKKLEKAECVLYDMRSRGFSPDAYIYSALISGYCKAGNSFKALELHDKMLSEGIKTNCVIMNLILQCFSQTGRVSELEYLFHRFKEMGILFDESCYNVVMDAFCKMGKVEAAMDLLIEMKSKHIFPDKINYTTLINGCVLKGDLRCAAGLFKEMRERGHKPDIAVYNVLASGYAKIGFQQVKNLLNFMESQGMKPETSTHNLIIKGLCMGGRVDEAESFFGNLEEKSLENYSSMINGLCEANCVKKAVDMFNKLAFRGLVVSKVTCVKLLKSLCVVGRTETAVSLLQSMIDLTVDHAKISKINSDVISSLCLEGKISAARRYLDMIVLIGMIPDVVTYTIMMNAYCKINCLREAYCLFCDMKSRGIEPDVITYTVLLDNWSKISLRNSRSGFYTCESQGNMINPSVLWGEMKEMEIEPDVICYTVLIDRHCKTNNVAEAVSFFGEIIDRGMQPDTVTYTALLSGLCNEEDIEKAEILIDEMSNKGIPTDFRFESVKWSILKARKVFLEKSAI